jgi:propionyl-CoA carboxylase alpha chain
VTIAERTRTVAVLSVEDGRVDLDTDGRRMSLHVTRDGADVWVHGPWGDIELTEAPRFPPPAGVEVAGGLSAPMPGKVVAVNVSVGDEVERGQVLVVMEAMKMEHTIPAPHAGTVTEILVAVGDQVAQGAVLLALSGGDETVDGLG